VNYTRTPVVVELKINDSDLFGVVIFSRPTGHRSVHMARRYIRDGNLFLRTAPGTGAVAALFPLAIRLVWAKR